MQGFAFAPLNFSPELSKFGKLEDPTDNLKEDALDGSVNPEGQADLGSGSERLAPQFLCPLEEDSALPLCWRSLCSLPLWQTALWMMRQGIFAEVSSGRPRSQSPVPLPRENAFMFLWSVVLVHSVIMKKPQSSICRKMLKSHLWKLTRKNPFIATAIVYFDVKLLALFPETFLLQSEEKSYKVLSAEKKAERKKFA